MTASEIRIGVLCPLSPPGWVEAGRHLLAGMRQAAADVAAEGGPRFKLFIRDTGADPNTAAVAVEEFGRFGVEAIAGEYHSLAAIRAAERAEALRIPFVCSSAVIDRLTEQPSDWVVRIAPQQSRGWHVFADYLQSIGHARVAAVKGPGEYWNAGSRLIHEHVNSRGGQFATLDLDSYGDNTLCDEIAHLGSTCALLLVGHPEPAVRLVKLFREDPRLGEVLLGAPAGQPEFGEWLNRLGSQGASIPFLRYRPAHLTAHGAAVERALAARSGSQVSFVALEGYDTIRVLVQLVAQGASVQANRGPNWQSMRVVGTRGTITFSRRPGQNIWHWADAPIQLVERCAQQPASIRTLWQS